MPIIQKLIEAKKAIGYVGKDGYNEQQKFNFRGIDAVVAACAPVFNQLGILVVPHVLESDSTMVTYGRNNTVGFRVELLVAYTFTDGEDEIEAVVAAEAIDAGDKGTSKAMSVAFRTALLQALTLPTDAPDPDAESYEVTNSESQRVALLTQINDFLAGTDLSPAEKRALAEQALGGTFGKFTDLTLREAEVIMAKTEDPAFLARFLLQREAASAVLNGPPIDGPGEGK